VGVGLAVAVAVGVGVAVAVAVAVAVTVGLGVAVAVAVGVNVAVAVAVGVGEAVGVGVGVVARDSAQYLPPVFTCWRGASDPPDTIISLPVHTAVCSNRPSGTLVVLVAAQLSLTGSYLPPILK
jgi:hypothetical protein